MSYRALLLSSLIVLTGNVWAVPVTTNGITFSENTGDFTLISASGTGTLVDPIVLTETVNGPDIDLIIEIDFGNLGAYPALGGDGMWLKKVVTNGTSDAWSFFDMELQQVIGVASLGGDGLSFDDGNIAGGNETSDIFAVVDKVTDVRDFVNFSGGIVAPAATVEFMVPITDFSFTNPIYLRQRPNFRVGVPEPATLSLCLLAAFGVAARRKPSV